MCHDTLLGGHLGINKTIHKIKQIFHWYRLGDTVRAHIRKCSICCSNNQPHKKLRAALGNYRVGHPLDRIALDILGPLPTTNRGNAYILVVADYFTRWVEAYPLADQQASTTATKLVYEFISRLGAPLEIHTDQGRNFESNIFKEVCWRLRRPVHHHPILLQTDLWNVLIEH